MTGYLIYDKDNVQRNMRFIGFFMEAAKKYNVSLQVVTTDQIITGTKDTNLFSQPALPAFAVMRCMNPFLSSHLEKMGVRCFNSSLVSRTCNDKRITHTFFSENHLPSLPTAFVSLSSPLHPFSYPVVVKAARSCGGRKVFLCQNIEEYHQHLKDIFPDDAVVQPLCDTPGKDVRVYMLNGQPVQAMLRYSGDDDFRSNFGLHGTAKPITPTKEMLDFCHRIADLLHPDLVGIDFIFHQNKTYLNEIEDAVGTRMLYQYTDLQIVDDYMAHIFRSL